MTEELYPFDTEEHFNKNKPYGFIDPSPELFQRYQEKRNNAKEILADNPFLNILPSEEYYSEEELSNLSNFESHKVLQSIFKKVEFDRVLSPIHDKHFWKLLKKAELRKFPVSYDKNFKSLLSEKPCLISHSMLALTLWKYAKSNNRGYLQAISTALKENDFLISQIERLESPLEKTLAASSLEIENEIMRDVRKKVSVLQNSELESPKLYKAQEPTAIKNLGMLVQESNRTKAYLQGMIKSNLLPNFVILVHNPAEVDSLDTLPSGKENLFFNPNFPEVISLAAAKVPYKIVCATSMEDAKVIEEIKKREEGYFVYSGKSILKEVLDTKKQFIHVHPGELPKYRGSTCNFYSVLAGDGWHCTSFIMSKGIDQGKIIASREFSLPDKNVDDSRIYDPFTRSVVLVDTLKQLEETGTLESKNQNLSEGLDYYIMHPSLRCIRAEYLNSISSQQK